MEIVFAQGYVVVWWGVGVANEHWELLGTPTCSDQNPFYKAG